MAESPTAEERPATFFSRFVRFFGWSMLTIMVVFLVNNFLTHGAGMPGAAAPLDGNSEAGGILQLALNPLAILSMAGTFFR